MGCCGASCLRSYYQVAPKFALSGRAYNGARHGGACLLVNDLRHERFALLCAQTAGALFALSGASPPHLLSTS